ncbi:MAG: hypothetical protein PHE58_06250 [Candidatus Omnitrophica bacterium]|nr:hypothetical protein [Candidatus Omnitrophota bacterium]
MKNRISFLSVVLCAMVISGCVSVQPLPKNNALLEPSAVMKFSDIPVPAGFKSLPDESYSFENGGMRVGVIKYRGKGNADLVVNFYKEQMAMHGWELLNVIEYNDRLMNFEKESESCIINISPRGNSATISISFGPKNAAGTRRSGSVKDKTLK